MPHHAEDLAFLNGEGDVFENYRIAVAFFQAEDFYHPVPVCCVGAQEDARRITFGPGAKLTLTGPDSGAAWRISYLVGSRPAGPVTVTAGGKALDITQGLSVAEGKGWREMVLTLACLGSTGKALTFTSTAPFAFQISEITRDEAAASAECSF